MASCTTKFIKSPREIIYDLLNQPFNNLDDIKYRIDQVNEQKSLCPRTDTSAHKRFFYEIMPIYTLLERLFSDQRLFEIRFTAAEEECGYDAELHMDKDIIKIECVRAVDGHNEGLQLEHMEKYGRAPASQDIIASGTKNNREMDEQQAVCVNAEVTNNKIENLIIDAFQHKQKDKYRGYWLIITFNDWMNLSFKRQKLLDSTFSNMLESNNLNHNIFERIIIIGDSQKFLWNSRNV